MALQIRLLGSFSAHRDGRPLTLSSRKVAAMLAILASRPGAILSRARIADLLWSRSAEAQARASLRQALGKLRRELGTPEAPAVEASGDGIRLRPDIVRVDAAEVEASLADGTPERLERAAALYAGDFLDGFVLKEDPFEEWRRIEAVRLRTQALQGLRRLLEHHVANRDDEAAAALGERLLGIEPAAEEIHQALMRLHVERGALGSAMRQYERCRTALETELGVPPSEDTELLRRRIRARPRSFVEEGTDAGAPPAVAVLPFANLSEDPAQNYFAQGFTEDVVRELSRFRSFRVLAAHSSFAAAGDPGVSPREIGERLGARYLLSGSVRRAARSIRVGAELVDAKPGHHLWAHRYDVPFEAIFEAQDEIARSVTGALAARLDDEQLKQARRKPIDNLQAYDCWLRGVACLRHGTLESHAAARKLFERALEVDPEFARAYAGLSLTHFNEWSCQAWDRWAEKERLAFEYASRAVALDEADGATQFILGRILLYRREFERAERHLARAEELNPSDADVLAQLALSHAYLGQPERGIEAGRLAMRLNPFHDDWYFAFAAAPYAFARRLEEAIPLALKSPDVATDIRAYLAAAYAHLGRIEAAERQIERFLQVFRRNITFGREPEPDEPARWILHVNPLRRETDRAYLLEGLERAGLIMPADLRP